MATKQKFTHRLAFQAIPIAVLVFIIALLGITNAVACSELPASAVFLTQSMAGGNEQICTVMYGTSALAQQLSSAVYY